ncbi:MAG: hypothetical protein KF729_19765 [Sandaracinaceae bacterium]|nr:hypothetical protein [Sandaracinaceae bacterium]
MGAKDEGVSALFDRDEVREVLEGAFYKPGPAAARERSSPRRRASAKDDLPYEVICISLYKEDLRRLDEKVKLLKARGHRKMSRSALIRYALDTANLDDLPKAY